MLLRWTLLINGIATSLTGLALVLAPRPLARLLGVSAPTLLVGTGVALVLYAGGLIWTARSRAIPGVAAWAAIALDLAWVASSIALLEAGLFTPIGNGLVGLVAAAVFVFATLQWVGVRRLSRPA